MTNPTPHGQVPEALIDLIDAYAETRHRCGGIYNAKTEAARNAVIEALSGVRALSAAPAGLITHGKQCKALGARLSDMVMRLRAAPKQEVQEHHGWLYEWTHSSATGKPDSTYTAFTTDGAHARKHDNCRAIYTAPKSAPAGVLEDAARWHWMAEYIVGTRTDLDDELIACPTVDELRKLVDADLAARKQGANHDKT